MSLGEVDLPEGGAGREMTLHEWVDRLPPLHRARGELRQLDEDSSRLGDEIERVNQLEAALTTIRDTLPERQDAYARLVFATAAEALEPETAT